MRQRGSKQSEKEPEIGIMLSKTFRIVGKDDKNVELEEFIKYKDKEENPLQKWEGKGYYSTIEAAVLSYCNLKQRRAKSMSDLLDIIKNLRTEIHALFKIEI